MKIGITLSLAGALLFTSAGFAADPQTNEATQRNLNQQERIEQGLKSGQLSTKEAGKLEAEQARINRTEARDLKQTGRLTPAEQARINQMQNKASADIYRDKHNAVTGNPNSASSQRMQADVQRNVNQQARIRQGAASGSLTNREVGTLEHGQAKVEGRESNAAANGKVSAGEQARIQRAQDRQSKRIAKDKHD